VLVSVGVSVGLAVRLGVTGMVGESVCNIVAADVGGAGAVFDGSAACDINAHRANHRPTPKIMAPNRA